MTEPVLAFALLGVIAAVSIGFARIMSWLLDRREHTAAQQSSEAAFVADPQGQGRHTYSQGRCRMAPRGHQGRARTHAGRIGSLAG